MQRIQIAMPGRFVPDGLLEDGLHTRPIQALDGILIRCMETWFQLAVRHQPQAVALTAEVGIDGAYKADVALCAGQAVQAWGWNVGPSPGHR